MVLSGTMTIIRGGVLLQNVDSWPPILGDLDSAALRWGLEIGSHENLSSHGTKQPPSRPCGHVGGTLPKPQGMSIREGSSGCKLQKPTWADLRKRGPVCGTHGCLTEHRATGPRGQGTGLREEMLSKAQPCLCPSSFLLLSTPNATFSLGFHVCGEQKMASTQLPKAPCPWTLQADQPVFIPISNSRDRDSNGPRSGLLRPPGSGTGSPRSYPASLWGHMEGGRVPEESGCELDRRPRESTRSGYRPYVCIFKIA